MGQITQKRKGLGWGGVRISGREKGKGGRELRSLETTLEYSISEVLTDEIGGGKKQKHEGRCRILNSGNRTVRWVEHDEI